MTEDQVWVRALGLGPTLLGSSPRRVGVVPLSPPGQQHAEPEGAKPVALLVSAPIGLLGRREITPGFTEQPAVGGAPRIAQLARPRIRRLGAVPISLCGQLI